MTAPRVSIVTVVYNGEPYLETCIESVVAQTYDNVEYIVIDGGSTDGTVDIIRQHEAHIDTWLSEPDDGVYDAMNKGIKRATGDVIGLVNADDFLEPNAAEIVAQAHQESPDSILAAAMNRVLEDGTTYVLRKHLNQTHFEKTIPHTMPINHPATFVPASVYQDLGTFDTQFDILGDYDFVCRAYVAGVPFRFVDRVLSNMRIGGLSSGMNNAVKRAVERYQVRKKNGLVGAPRNAALSLRWLLTTVAKSSIRSVLPDDLTARFYQRRHGETDSSTA
jgi:glycosyltransferase involved in cell wall biosynthesis